MPERLFGFAAGNLHLPADVVLGEMLVSFVGSRRARIENYRGILFYDGNTLRLQGNNGRLELTGKALCIDSYDREELQVSGQIRGMTFYR